MRIIKSIKKLKRSTKILLGAFLIVLLFSVGSLAFNASKDSTVFPIPEISQETTENVVDLQQQIQEVIETEPASTPATKPEAAQWPLIYSMDQANSLTVVVNKKHKLPSDYVPVLSSVAGGQMRPEAANALSELLTSANNAGLPMKLISSYRSYETQINTYNKWVKLDGQAQADRSSARPGHSEHQTGLAADLGMPDGSCNLEICFGSTPQGRWLAENAPSFGFIIRYENGTEAITGYQYEPWHIRYLGVDVAKLIVASGKTLDQYYNVEAGDY